MITRTRPWFSFSAPNSTVVRCSACGHSIDLGPRADHHPARCPHCAVESAFLNWNGRIVQVVPPHAPAAFVAALRWAQHHLDELEYVELLCALEELVEGATSAGGPPNR